MQLPLQLVGFESQLLAGVSPSPDLACRFLHSRIESCDATGSTHAFSEDAAILVSEVYF